jgi:hypothetical protein
MAIFSKRHYEWLARELRTNDPGMSWGSYDEKNFFDSLVGSIAEALQKDNAKFDRQRFLDKAIAEEFVPDSN